MVKVGRIAVNVVVSLVVLHVVLAVVSCLNMKKLKYYIVAMRLRTLPLSISGVMLGLLLAASDYIVRPGVMVFAVLTTVLLQILSNVSNELGDTLRGTDREGERMGPGYALAQGHLDIRDYKVMIWVYVLLSAVSGLAMIWLSFGTFFDIGPFILILLGFKSISSAMKYTLGRNPYGYRGLGDLYVFSFFGVVAVLGSYFVAAHTIRTWMLLLPAVSMGCFSVGVLNVNNIRDMKSDAATRKTVPLMIGEKNAKIYHTLLIVTGWAAMLVYSGLRIFDWWHYIFVLTLPLFVVHLSGVWRNSGKDLDRQLPLLVASSSLFALLAGIGFVAYLL